MLTKINKIYSTKKIYLDEFFLNDCSFEFNDNTNALSNLFQ
jgi:hypothetical protein